MAIVTKYTAKGEEQVVVKVGDYVRFKSDVEQGGKVTGIDGIWLELENKYGFEGEYIGGMTETRVAYQDCWMEG